MDAAWQPQQGRINWLKYSSPQTFFPLAGKMAPWFAGAALVF
jgi:heme exporter protein C